MPNDFVRLPQKEKAVIVAFIDVRIDEEKKNARRYKEIGKGKNRRR